MSNFAFDVQRWVKKVEKKLDNSVKLVSFEVLAGCMFLSPVDTGRFRGNWRVGVNTTDKTVNWFELDPAGTSLGLKTSTLAPVTRFDTVYITNNLHYASELERGKSRQAPAGIINPVVTRVVSTWPALVRTL